MAPVCMLTNYVKRILIVIGVGFKSIFIYMDVPAQPDAELIRPVGKHGFSKVETVPDLVRKCSEAWLHPRSLCPAQGKRLAK